MNKLSMCNKNQSVGVEDSIGVKFISQCDVIETTTNKYQMGNFIQ